MSLSFDNPSLYYNLKVFQMGGLWPLSENSRICYRMHSFLGYILHFLFTTFTMTECVKIYYIWGDIEEVMINIGVTLHSAMVVIKIHFFLFMQCKNRSLVNKISLMEKKVVEENNLNIRKILNNYSNKNKTVTKFFLIISFFSWFSYTTIPFVEFIRYGSAYVKLENGTVTDEIKLSLMLSSWFPFDENKSPYYQISYVYQITISFIGGYLVAAWDTYIFALMTFAVGQLRILQCRLKNIGENKWSTKYKCEDIWYQYLIDCVNDHNEIIK